MVSKEEIIHTKLTAMSYLSDKTGRPKEEGGHERINISVDDFTAKALEKVKNNDGNVSQFIEKELQPVLKGLDPGKASNVIYQIDVYVASRIVDAAQKEDYETVKALSSVKIALSDHMKLAGVPPLDFELEKPRVGNGCYSEQEYTLAINHSKNLIDSLDTYVLLAREIPETFEQWKKYPMKPKQREVTVLEEATEEHLKTGYPALYAQILEYDTLLSETERIAEQIRGEFGFYANIPDLVGKVACFAHERGEHGKYAVPKQYRKNVERLVKKFDADRIETIYELEKRKTNQYLQIIKELQDLIFQINNGEPLQGTCNLCPKVKIKKQL